MKHFELADESATEAFGARLAAALEPYPGAVIYLEGELGAGKTTLARGLLRAMGVHGRVKSPTYTLMELYEPAGRRVLHMDLYRLNDPLELQNLGLADFARGNTLWLVEWPQRGAHLLPACDLTLKLQAQDEGRILTLQARPGFAPDLCQKLGD